MAFGWTDEEARRIAGQTKPKSDSVLGCQAIILAAVLAVILGVWIFASAMEARAYERITGKKVSTWDAMWVELRVQEGARE